jgi:peptidoglycan/xylan/chitin deacetylase (PgdA/CDA1 family)
LAISPVRLAGNRLTTILFHRFFFEGEHAEDSRDRLKRQCDWLRKWFNPVTLSEATNGVSSGRFPRNPLLVTIDDAKVEVLSILDIFQSFSIPISIFACVGWCAKEEPDNTGLALARLIAELEWYRGPQMTLLVGRETLAIGEGVHTADSIDHLLEWAVSEQVDTRELSNIYLSPSKARPNITCTLQELADIKSPMVAIGAHSISHINLAEASDIRLTFEVSQSRKLLIETLGECDTFAYPYGMAATFSATTSQKLIQAGFSSAFLSHSDFAGPGTDRLQLPRIAMPDRPISHSEFCVRVAGLGALYRKLKHTFKPNVD